MPKVVLYGIVFFVVYKIYNWLGSQNGQFAQEPPRYNYNPSSSGQTDSPVYAPSLVKSNPIVKQTRPPVTVQEVLNVSRNMAKVQPTIVTPLNGQTAIAPITPKPTILPVQQQKGIDINNMLNFFSTKNLNDPAIKMQFESAKKLYGLV